MVRALLSSGGHCRLNHGTCLSVDLRDFRRARHSPRLHTDRGDCSTAPRRPDGVRHSGGGAGMRVPRLRRERRLAVQEGLRRVFSNMRLIWLYPAPFTPSGRVKMRPGWSRLALRSLVRTEPARARGGHFGPHHEWLGVAKLLISAHFRSFPIIPLVDGGGCRAGVRFLPSRERRQDSRERRVQPMYGLARRRRNGRLSLVGACVGGAEGLGCEVLAYGNDVFTERLFRSKRLAR